MASGLYVDDTYQKAGAGLKISPQTSLTSNVAIRVAMSLKYNMEVSIAERPKELADKTSQRPMTVSDVICISILAKFHSKSHRPYTQ